MILHDPPVMPVRSQVRPILPGEPGYHRPASSSDAACAATGPQWSGGRSWFCSRPYGHRGWHACHESAWLTQMLVWPKVPGEPSWWDDHPRPTGQVS